MRIVKEGNLNLVEENLGRCLVMMRLEDFEEVAKKYTSFFSVSQFMKQPQTLSDAVGVALTEPKLRTAEVLYGVESDGGLTFLGRIVDSSD